MKNSKLIDPSDYDVVICIEGKAGRLFEHGKETGHYVKKIELSHEAGSRAELTVKKHVFSKDAVEHLDKPDVYSDVVGTFGKPEFGKISSERK